MDKCENCIHAIKFYGKDYCKVYLERRKLGCRSYAQKPQIITIEMALPKGDRNEKKKLC